MNLSILPYIDTDYDYYNSKLINVDLYALKLHILQDYYRDKYRNEVVDNQIQYEKDFDDYFVFNYN